MILIVMLMKYHCLLPSDIFVLPEFLYLIPYLQTREQAATTLGLLPVGDANFPYTQAALEGLISTSTVSTYITLKLF